MIKIIKFWRRKRKQETRFRYRRHLVPLNKRKKLLEKLERLLKQQTFFENLRIIKDHITVRKYQPWFFGPGIVIKRTGYVDRQGYDFQEIRKSIRVHQQAVRNGTIKADNYRIITPRVYGRIGEYLVMEYMEEMRSFEHLPAKIYEQLKENFSKLKEAGHIKIIPQPSNLILLGNTNPQNPEKGKWLIAMPYDVY